MQTATSRPGEPSAQGVLNTHARDHLPEPATHHTVHCPFCFTVAFAVEPPAGELQPARVEAQARPQRRSLQLSRTPPRQADPRAPPVSDHLLS